MFPNPRFFHCNSASPFFLCIYFPCPFSTLCTYITLTGVVNSIYWFLSMFMLMPFHLHPLSVSPTSPTSLSLSVSFCLLPLSLPSHLSTPVICINQSGVRRAEEPHIAVWGRLAVVSLYRHYQRGTSSLVLSTALDLLLSIFSSQPTATCARALTVKVCWAHKWGLTCVIEEIWRNILSALLMTNWWADLFLAFIGGVKFHQILELICLLILRSNFSSSLSLILLFIFKEEWRRRIKLRYLYCYHIGLD